MPTNGTNPTFKAIGPLAFSPDGVLFAGDTQAAAIFALDLGKAATGGAPGAKAIPGVRSEGRGAARHRRARDHGDRSRRASRRRATRSRR